MLVQNTAHYDVALASSEADIRAAQELRYRVFVEELGSAGPGVDHEKRIEQDTFDGFADHLILRDRSAQNHVVGVYRLLHQDKARAAGGFYSGNEFDLSPLLLSERRLLELGRSCLHPDHRGGAALLALWQGLEAYVKSNAIDVIFGVASFHGTDVDQFIHAVSHLQNTYLAPTHLRATSRMECPITLLQPDQVNRKKAMRDTPALIKSYLKQGAVVGEGIYVDHDFNTTDVCLILETSALRSMPSHPLTASVP